MGDALSVPFIVSCSKDIRTHGGRGNPLAVKTSLGISTALAGGRYSELCFRSSYKSLTIRTDRNLRIWNSMPSSVSNVRTPGT